jgi:hypothetical protein
MELQVEWIKCGKTPQYCPFEEVDLSQVASQGVYIIWHGLPNSWTVRIGSGDIKKRLEAHRRDPQILAYRQHGGLWVIWGAVHGQYQHGVENYLADLLNPLVGERFPNVEPIAVNSPFAA